MHILRDEQFGDLEQKQDLSGASMTSSCFSNSQMAPVSDYYICWVLCTDSLFSQVSALLLRDRVCGSVGPRLPPGPRGQGQLHLPGGPSPRWPHCLRLQRGEYVLEPAIHPAKLCREDLSAVWWGRGLVPTQLWAYLDLVLTQLQVSQRDGYKGKH